MLYDYLQDKKIKHYPDLYYPTTIFCLDNDPLFLDAFYMAMGNYFPIVLSSDPEKSIAYLEEYYKNFQNYVSSVDDTELDYTTEFIYKIDALTYLSAMKRERYCLPTIIFIDYMMEAMMGDEVALLLKDLPIKKVLLTGHYDTAMAIQLLNDKIIDSYINKEELLQPKKLKKLCAFLQLDFFLEQHGYLYEQVSKIISNSDTMRDFIINNRIVEFYHLDDKGSCLFFNDQDSAFLKIILDIEELDLADENIRQYQSQQSNSLEKIDVPLLYWPASERLFNGDEKELSRRIEFRRIGETNLVEAAYELPVQELLFDQLPGFSQYYRANRLTKL